MRGAEQEREGRQKERGNALGFWFFIVCLRVFGLRGTYGLLYIVCLYYLLIDRSLVSSAVPYVSRRFPGCGLFRERLHVYRLLVSQGKQLIDRYAVIAEHKVFDIRLRGHEEFVSQIRESAKGAIVLTSHEGSWQMAMTALEKMGKTVHVVMLPAENAALQETLYPERERRNVRVISPRQYLGGVIEIVNALGKGDVVSIMGDRRYGARAVEVSFLGDKAWFPYSAFSVAAATECPIVVLSAAKLSTYEYVVDMTNVLCPRYEGRRNKVGQLQPWVQEFASLMESFVKEHPYQCFLWRDVWRDEGDGLSG